ncbi:cupin domain-containing protein [Cupriavidus sp. 8B]|jgi:uncharacterized cupin superfamily protein
MGIQAIRSSATIDTLVDKGAIASLGDPACRVSSAEVIIPERSSYKTGLWECTPGRFRRQVAAAEVMYILSGSGDFRTDAGDVFPFGSGDTLFFPPETHGIWNIQETVRKVYVLL